jgi:hypothetical protein
MENVTASSTPTDSREYINVGCCDELNAVDVADGYARIRGLGRSHRGRNRKYAASPLSMKVHEDVQAR